MVDVGYVRVAVDQCVVGVGVLVPFGGGVGVDVVVMPVVMGVLMVVGDRRVVMVMFVIAAHHKRHTRDRDHQRGDLPPRRGITQHRPGDHSSDERRGGEHELAAGRAEITGTGHPQRDRHPIAEPADHQRDERCPQRWHPVQSQGPW